MTDKDNVDKYSPVDPASLNFAKLPGVIDQTLLKPESTLEEYALFCREAERRRFRAVFVPPCYVPMAAGLLSAADTLVGAPIGFPFGYQAPEVKAAEALQALDDGAQEIDMVMNISAARSGEWDLVREDLDAVVESVRAWGKLHVSKVNVKLILENPYLDDEQKVQACRLAAEAGLDYVKTATGFGPGGATVADVALMRRTVGSELGVKASGGIRTWADMRAMLEAGANLIGTSAGVQIVEDFIDANRP